jgi:hypothetical protein
LAFAVAVTAKVSGIETGIAESRAVKSKTKELAQRGLAGIVTNPKWKPDER